MDTPGGIIEADTAEVGRRRPPVRTLAAAAIVGLVLAGAVIGQGLDGDADTSASFRDREDATREDATREDAGAFDRLAASSPGYVLGGDDGGGVGLQSEEVVSGATSGGGAAGGSSSALVSVGPQIVRTARLEVEVEEGSLRVALDRVLAAATRFDGLVANTSLREDEVDDHAGSASVILRIPTDRFDEARRELADLGELASLEIGGQDVSGQLVDLDARLRNLRAQESALLELLGRAEVVGEIIQVQTQVFEVREQIERLAAQQASLEDRVALATVEVVLFEPGAVFRPSPEPATGLAQAWDEAVDGAESVVAGMVVALGFAFPIVLVALVVWLLLRWRRPTSMATAG